MQKLLPSEQKMKAIALMRSGHEIDALELFKQLYYVCPPADDVIYYILALSINNKRLVPQNILTSAELSDNPQILCAVSTYYNNNFEHEKAMSLIRRALFRCSSNETYVFSQYFRIVLDRTAFIPGEISCVDVNTIVALSNAETKKQLTFCIHPNNELPHDNLVWEGATHIYTDTAVKLGIYKKKLSSVVTIDNTEFMISGLDSLDTYLFRICMDKQIAAGQMTMIHLPLDSSGRVDQSALLKQMQL